MSTVVGTCDECVFEGEALIDRGRTCLFQKIGCVTGKEWSLIPDGRDQATGREFVDVHLAAPASQNRKLGPGRASIVRPVDETHSRTLTGRLRVADPV